MSMRQVQGVIEPSINDGDNKSKVVRYTYDYQKIDDICYSVMNEHLTHRMKEYCDNIREKSSKQWLERTQSMLAGDLSEEYGLNLLDDRELYFNFQESLRIILSHVIGGEVVSFNFSGMWANYQKPNECNPIHRHTAMLSLVWYLDVPQIIREEHKSEKGTTPNRGLITFLSMFSNEEMVMNPKTNDLLIFNSQHPHQVYPYKSDVERVSLSANVSDIVLYDESAHSSISGGRRI